MSVPNPIIPSDPMRAAVTKTSETVNVQNTTLETKGHGQIASTDSTAARPAVYGEIDAEGLKAATNKIRSACYRFSSLQPDMEAWLESIAYSVIRAYHDATPAPEPQPEVAAEPVVWISQDTMYDLQHNKPWVAGAFGEFSQKRRDTHDVPLYSRATPSVVEEAVKADAWQGKMGR